VGDAFGVVAEVTGGCDVASPRVCTKESGGGGEWVTRHLAFAHKKVVVTRHLAFARKKVVGVSG
jgi:hypothetical protein